MLTLHGITKVYETAGETVNALKGVDLCFRRHEFVSILGHSGCGKTTLLNIIGGLDQYTNGDLQIDGISTKDFSDRDWDSYRNHRIGFVFQSYQLIPHQSVLSNVELALTLSGVSRAERKRRATEALVRVGLADQLNKKPGQMSGGQMQRVAIARALVNNPEILLADEPTGALDTQTSEQIMDLLKEVASDRLVIMVTHNPELAEEYSTRIIRLTDGQVVSDTDPYTAEQADAEQAEKRNGVLTESQETVKTDAPTKKAKKQKANRQERTSMSLFSAVALSFDNLLTKKTRTFLTSFAGSIGIIGIALVLALSNGIQLYIDRVEEDALSSYPITLESVTMDMGEILATMTGNGEAVAEQEEGYIYSSPAVLKMMNAFIGGIKTNDLKAFKAFLESEDTKIADPDVATVVYEYGITPNIWHMYDDGKGNKKPVQASPSSVMDALMGMSGATVTGGFGISLFDQMLGNEDLLNAQYDVLDGRWPTAFNEVVLVTDGNSQINDLFLYGLGIKDPDELKDLMADLYAGNPVSVSAEKYSYADLMAQTFTLVVEGDLYTDEDNDNVFSYQGKDTAFVQNLIDTADQTGSRAVTLKISGIVRPKKDAAATSISGTVGYTAGLVDYLLNASKQTAVVQAQKANPQVDILTGKPFSTGLADSMPSEKEQAAQMLKILSPEGKSTETLREQWSSWLEAKYFCQRLATAETVLNTALEGKSEEERVDTKIWLLANLFVAHKDDIMAMPGVDMGGMFPGGGAMGDMGSLDAATVSGALGMLYQNGQMSEEEISESLLNIVAYFGETSVFGMSTTLLQDLATAKIALNGLTPESVAEQYPTELAALGEKELSYLWMAEYGDVSEGSYNGNMRLLGEASKDSPSSILIYPVSFDQKDFVNREINRYNKEKTDAQKIVYTDYIGVLFSSISMILNIVTYVLVAFASISLVVSSIMIGIITYISVLERTKEIGILRAVGASKRDVSRVFNAETLMIGFVAGVIGVGATLVLCLPINAIIRFLSGVQSIGAKLPFTAGVLLVVVSVVITVISGLIPSRLAAKKDPVEALRTE